MANTALKVGIPVTIVVLSALYNHLEKDEQHPSFLQTLANLFQNDPDLDKFLAIQVQELKNQLNTPIKKRKEKIDFVNSLKLEIKRTKNLALVGPSGVGKSTFLYLLGKGDKPKLSTDHGTKELNYNNGFVDTIGINWDIQSLFKLMVLFIYDGIPADMLCFSNNGRVKLVIASLLSAFEMTSPLIVDIMAQSFWVHHEHKAIHLETDKTGVKKVRPEENLKFVYSSGTYETMKNMGIGKGITHHDNIGDLLKQRQKNGIDPFSSTINKLGKTFTVSEGKTEPTIEYLFRFIYLFEKVYRKNQLEFMKNCKLEDFANI